MSHILFFILCDTQPSKVADKGDIPLVPRSLKLVGLNSLTSNLQLGKLLSSLVGVCEGFLYSVDLHAPLQFSLGDWQGFIYYAIYLLSHVEIAFAIFPIFSMYF